MKKQKEKKQKFKILHDEIVFNGKFIKTIRRHFLDRAGHKIFWEMVERKLGGRNGKKKRIVAIAAITPKREIVLEKCFRVPLKDYTIELPAGLMDKPGESEKSAIRPKVSLIICMRAKRLARRFSSSTMTMTLSKNLSITSFIEASEVKAFS